MFYRENIYPIGFIPFFLIYCSNCLGTSAKTSFANLEFPMPKSPLAFALAFINFRNGTNWTISRSAFRPEYGPFNNCPSKYELVILSTY